MLIQPNSKLLFIGDSITDCDRARPVGEAPDGGLGMGYVGMVDGLITATHPEANIRVVNMGISGNTVRHLKERWQSDVLDLQPDWLSVMIGINDVWRHFDTRLQVEWQVPHDEYANTLEELVRTTEPRLKGLVLMTPFFIEPNSADPMRRMMNRYGATVRDIAERYRAIFVDTQAAFDEVLEKVHSYALAGDRVHANAAGHFVLARAFLKAVGYCW
jgi:lysophospholipase L1-like esterase